MSRPDTPPAIRFNFLSAALDREVTLEAMRITRRIKTSIIEDPNFFASHHAAAGCVGGSAIRQSDRSHHG